jgi:hypothetical protein
MQLAAENKKQGEEKNVSTSSTATVATTSCDTHLPESKGDQSNAFVNATKHGNDEAQVNRSKEDTATKDKASLTLPSEEVSFAKINANDNHAAGGIPEAKEAPSGGSVDVAQITDGSVPPFSTENSADAGRGGRGKGFGTKDLAAMRSRVTRTNDVDGEN